MRRWVLAVLFSMAAAHSAAASEPPRFEDYPVAITQPATQHAPLLSGKPIRTLPFDANFHPPFTRFKTYLSYPMDETIKPFAGHYRISTWGCGTACNQSAIIDNITGKVYGYLNMEISPDSRPDSRLLILNPGLDEYVAQGYASMIGQHTSYWVWNSHGLKPLAVPISTSQPVRAPL